MQDQPPATTSYPLRAPFSCKDWTFEDILATSSKFKRAPTISATKVSFDDLLHAIQVHEATGVPLVIQDFHCLQSWKHDILNPQWLLNNCPDEVMPVRDMWALKDGQMTFKDFLDYAATTPKFATENEIQRFYGKDAPCPSEWAEWLQSGCIPSRVEPMGEGDLFRCLAEDERPETLMTYFGIGDTFTPCHKDPCASQGQNLMTYAESDASAFWFFTNSNQSYAVATFFAKKMRTELDWEATYLPPDQLQNLPCPVFVHEQTVGDLVLVPRKSCHQVVNKGGLTIKTSWSRMTMASLAEGIQEECPIYRRVCRPEVYRTRLMCYRAIVYFANYVTQECGNPVAKDAITESLEHLQTLLPVFDEVLESEWEPQHESIVPYAGSQIPVCDFCGADIFESFLECTRCVDPEGDVGGAYQICAACYVEGRSCECRVMTPTQRWSFHYLIRDRNRAAALLEAVPAVDANILDAKTSNRVFQAAYLLSQRRKNDNAAKPFARCSLGGTNAHDTPWDNVARCHGCNRGFCRKHSLAIRRSHASDEILDANAERSSIYHAQHVIVKRKAGTAAAAAPHTLNNKELFNTAFGVTYGTPNKGKPTISPVVSIREVKPHLRLAWAATTFRDCRPIDNQRSVIGWYDNKPPTDVNDMTKQAKKVKAEPKEVDEIVPSDEDDAALAMTPTKVAKKRRRSTPGGKLTKPSQSAHRRVSLNAQAAGQSTDSEMSLTAGRLVGLGLRGGIPLPDPVLSDSDGAAARKRRRAEKRPARDQDQDAGGASPAPRAEEPDIKRRSSSPPIPLATQAAGPPQSRDDMMLADLDEFDPLALMGSTQEPAPPAPAAQSEAPPTVTVPIAQVSAQDRSAAIATYSTLYRALLDEQQNLSEAGKTIINDSLEQLASILGVRPLDLMLNFRQQPVPPPMVSPPRSSLATALLSSSQPAPLQANGSITSLSSQRGSVQPSPSRPRHLFPPS